MLSLIKNSKGFAKSSDLGKLIDALNKQRPQKVIKGFITQSSTTAPTVTYLINELGTTAAPIVWTRTSAGAYLGTLAGKFLAGKVWCSVTKAGASDAIDISLGRATDNAVALASTTGGTATDGLINNVSFSIEIWP